MNNIDKIKELESIIKQTKKQIDDLDRLYKKAFMPKGYGKGTSYNDYDTIKGGNKEFHIEDYSAEREKLVNLLELSENALAIRKTEVDINEYLGLLTNNYQKVKFLRKVKKCTQAETADILGIGERTVQRIEKNLG